MNVDADVPLVAQQRLARVDAHAHTDRRTGEPVAGPRRRRERVRRPRERNEEGVALDFDLHPTVRREGVPHHRPVCRQFPPVPVGTKLLQKPRRALDVSEQKGDGPGRKHHPRMSRRPGFG